MFKFRTSNCCFHYKLKKVFLKMKNENNNKIQSKNHNVFFFLFLFLAEVRTIMLIVKSRAYIKIKFIPVEFKQSMKHL